METRSIGRGDILYILYSIPSAEQVTGKLKNPCDSLLKTDSEACKEQKSKLDLISRQDAIDAMGEEPPVWYDGEGEIAERNQWRRDKAAIESLPSAEPKTGKCTGCKCIGSYDLDFSCVNCVRKTKDYYCGARMKGEEE